MTFPQAIQTAFKNYAKFDGRASRSEYWWFYLFQFLIMFVPVFVASLIGGTNNSVVGGIIGLIFIVAVLGTIIPGLAVSFRRLHDTDHSAWWMLISFIPFGGIVLLVWMASSGTLGPNKYGLPTGLNVIASTFN